MGQLLLNSGAYSARSYIADAQRCVNLYLENAPQEAGSATPTTHYPTPGLTLQFTFPIVGEVRQIYRSTTNQLYGVCGNNVYGVVYSGGAWTTTLLGVIGTFSGFVSMKDNGIQVLIGDGSSQGYQITMANGVFAQLSAANNSGTNGYGWLGASMIDYVDTFLIASVPGTNQWVSSYSNGTSFDSLQIATKSGQPDPLQGLVVAQRYVWLIGTLSSELWYDAGGTLFPFSIFSGPYVEHGAIAPGAINKLGEAVYWLSQDIHGQLMLVEGAYFRGTRVSNFAVETEWQSYGTVQDVRTWAYQVNGHNFLVIVFPSADKTWVFDQTTRQWHEWLWTDGQGVLHRHRGQCQTWFNGMNLVGDWQNGRVYSIDQTNYTDNGNPITRLRRFPHVIGEEDQRIEHNQFIANMQTGGGTSTDDYVNLRWSDDRGKNWGSFVQQSLGGLGKSSAVLSWRRLGIARDRVYELSWTAPYQTALSSAWLNGVKISKT